MLFGLLPTTPAPAELFWEPWAYWRTVTLLLASIWCLSGLVRLLLFQRRWERRLLDLGVSRPWMRRQLLRVVLRVTVLDPINLGLMLSLIGIWGARHFLF